MNATLERIRALQVMLAKEGPASKTHHTLEELLVFLVPIEFALLGLLFSTPFLQPVPLLGLSTPMGGILALLGLLHALGSGPSALPARFRNRPVATETIIKVLFYCEKLLVSLEKIPHLNLGRLAHWLAHPRVLAWFIVFKAVILALPLPIPFSNSLPAWGIVFTCLALIESNGFFVLLAWAFLLVNVFFFGALLYLSIQILMSDGIQQLFSREGFRHLSELMQNMF